MTIETGKEFCYEKLISLRKRGTQAEINRAVRQLGNYLKANSIKKAGPTITATFSSEQKYGETVLDMEILIPVDRLFAPEYGYIFKSKFQLLNAAHLCYKGKPELLQAICDEFIRYIREHEYHDTSAVYNVMADEPRLVNDGSGDITVDLYIDVSPNSRIS